MKANDHVEIIGSLPKELSKVKKPVYGTVTKVTGDKVRVKPRYKRFELEFEIASLKIVDYDKFNKAQKKKSKSVVKKVPKNPGISKVVAEAKEPTKKIIVKSTYSKAVVEEMTAKKEKETEVKSIQDIYKTATVDCTVDTKLDPYTESRTDRIEELDDVKGYSLYIGVIIVLVIACIAYFTLR